MKNETARREIESLDYYLQNHTDDYSEESHTAMMMAIDALNNAVLDKIRAEIEQIARPNEIGGRGNGKSIRYGLCLALQIIDKYRKEQI